MLHVPHIRVVARKLTNARLSRTLALAGLALGGCSSEHSEGFHDLTLDSGLTTDEGSAEGDPGADGGSDGASSRDDGGGHTNARDGGDGSDDDGGGAGASDASTDPGADGGPVGMDASASDAGAQGSDDAGALADASTGPGTVVEDDAGTHCDFGSAENQASTGTLNLFGQVVYFADGFVFPPGTYRVVYEDGCMKFAGAQAWTIHAYESTTTNHNWWIVGESSTERKVVAPGTVGIAVGAGGHQTFSQCVAANLGMAPRTFTHAGGRLGVWLHDSNYGDNVHGEDNRNPKWRLERLDGCAATPIE
jgi:hypothetical protein